MRKGMKVLCLLLVLFSFAIMAMGSGSAANSSETVSSTHSDTTASSVSESNPPSSQNTVTDNRSQAATASFTNEDFEVEGYLYENSIGDSLYFVIVKNNSNAVVSVEGNATAKDASGNAIGADSMSIDVIGPGETSIGYFYFDSVKGINTVDYQLNYAKQNYYYPVISNLEVQQVLNEGNVTITVTNKGSYNAEFVEAYALFFDANDNVIAYTSGYVTDNDSMIKPGATIAEQLDLYGKTYDHVKVYFTGRSDGKASVDASSTSSTDLQITEYQYDNSIGDTLWFLVVKNNSDKDVSVNANAIAYDSSGNMIGADDTSIDVLGAGQTSICYFYFSGVSGIARVDYQAYTDTASYYTDVIHNLSVNQTINNNNVIVAVTNNGAESAEFVEAYALFFDDQRNLVGYSSTYVTDADSEIKSGATITKQLDSYKPFSDVEVYFTGRHSTW